MSYLATGLHLLWLLWLRLLGNHGRCHILSCVLRAHRLLIGEPQRQRTLQRTVGCVSVGCVPATLVLTDLTADGRPSLWCHLHSGDRLATRCTPVTLNLHLRRWEYKRNKHAVLNYCVCADLLCCLTCGVRHGGVRGFAWAAGWRRRRPTVVEAVENLLQAGGVELGLRTWILGLLWWYEDTWAPIQHRFPTASWNSLTFSAVISGWDSSIPSSLRCSALTSA